jgi:hypothetical protein
MKTKGKVIVERNKYFVQVGDQKHELVPNAFGGAATFKQLAGCEVEVILSDPTLIAILADKSKLPPRCYSPCFICYKPRPDFGDIFEISPEIRQRIIDSFVNEGVLDKEVAAKAVGGML